ncbi:filamentous hemagglutinin outer membrane protein [[Leptolyngbya] sp. PCC 7376]|uniref:beta strand repeat-containing protein n=1 Tax=[Leptolyngbya] sp. PCC 7376 TaxID=111781 RepID=UPI00029F0BA5|nr:hypothetical protein [[Leptolyngbya] sp. PCC 7376]AFY39955.1 filamentous hemagglutinin outer membrane protein [[Leptolyngbya] sp. PCC 7376]
MTGDILTGNIEQYLYYGNNGNINLLTTVGDISTSEINQFLYHGDNGNINISTVTGNIQTDNVIGGEINVFALSGDISMGQVNTSSENERFSDVLRNSNDLSISTLSGDILIESVNSSLDTSELFEVPQFHPQIVKGGDINISTNTGSIFVGNILSFLLSNININGGGGNINLSTINGGIVTGDVFSAAISSRGISRSNGGKISILTNIGDVKTGFISSDSIAATSSDSTIILDPDFDPNFNPNFPNSNFFVVSPSGDAGDIQISTFNGDITSKAISASSFSLSDLVLYNLMMSGASFPLGDSGNGGDIYLSIKEKGDISIVGSDRGFQGDLAPIVSSLLRSDALLTSSTFSTFGESGFGGNIIIETPNILENVEILTLSSTSQSGAVSILGSNDLELNNIDVVTSKQLEIKLGSQPFEIKFSVDLGGLGQSGNVLIESLGNINLIDSSITSESNSSKPAGNVNIISPKTITLARSSVISDSNDFGDAGNIQFDTSTLNILEGSRVLAQTNGLGDGGTITINASSDVNLGRGVQDFSPILSVETSGAGKAGDIIVNTPVLNVFDTARVTATATENSSSREGGGSIRLNSDQMNLRGEVGIFAETQGESPAGILALKPYQNNLDLNVELFPNSKISASTSGSGRGGDLIVLAPRNIEISGAGLLSAETSSTGDAGNINITSQNLTLSEDVTISTSTAGSGNAGNIKLTVAEDLNILNSKILSSALPESSGNSGNIIIDPISTVLDNSDIAVSAQGNGIGGGIELISNRLSLINNSRLNAISDRTDAGNINVFVPEYLFLTSDSNITTNSGDDGGNINIITPFIIALPNQDNNIVAEAIAGNGGKINIFSKAYDSVSLFGIEFTGEDIALRNDISAKSDLGVDGEVLISLPEIDETAGLNELPADLVDAEDLVGLHGCAVEDEKIAGGSDLTLIGKGGLSNKPEGNVGISSPILIYLGNPDNIQEIADSQTSPVAAQNSSVVPKTARGWQQLEDGTLLLTFDMPSSESQTVQNSLPKHPYCVAQEN